jgi:hypothetical protein
MSDQNTKPKGTGEPESSQQRRTCQLCDAIVPAHEAAVEMLLTLRKGASLGQRAIIDEALACVRACNAYANNKPRKENKPCQTKTQNQRAQLT